MIYRELALPEPMRAAAQCAWRVMLEPRDPPAFMHKAPPDGAVNIALVLAPDGAAKRLVIGPGISSHEVPVTAGWIYAGLRLRPEAARAVTGLDPSSFAGSIIEAGAALDPVFGDIERLARDDEWPRDARGIDLFDVAGRIDAAVAEAVDMLIATGGTISIARLVAEAGPGARQFRRRFVAATGLSPKQYAGVQRLRRALLLSLAGESWANAALGAGFADQPHLCRAIRGTFGASPRIVGGSIGRIRHELVVPFVQDSGAAAG